MVVSDHEALMQEDGCRKQVTEIHRKGDPGVLWEFDDLELEQVISEQKSMPEYNLGLQQKDDFVFIEGLWYTLRPPPGKTAYAQLV